MQRTSDEREGDETLLYALDLFDRGWTFAQIAIRLGRTEATVHAAIVAVFETEAAHAAHN